MSLALKENQIGNKFVIYTTGIANWGFFDTPEQPEQNLIKQWNNGIREFLIAKIPEKFEVEIIHYDPLDSIKLEYIEEVINYIKKNLIDVEKSKEIESQFIKDYLELELLDGKKNYFVYDMAHIFQYSNKKNTVTVFGDEQKREFEINSLRTGFIGEDKIPYYLSLEEFVIDINNDGTVTTYIDRFIDLNIPIDNNRPERIFEDINEKIIRNIETILMQELDKKFFQIEPIAEELKEYIKKKKILFNTNI